MGGGRGWLEDTQFSLVPDKFGMSKEETLVLGQDASSRAHCTWLIQTNANNLGILF